MDNWNSKNAVIRDLERVSRGRLRVNIDTCLTSDKPYSWYTEEETEEDFYKRHCSGDTNFISPDLESINKLLVMVKDGDEIWEDESNNTIKVSKLNVKAKEFLPKAFTKNQVDKLTPAKQETLKICPSNAASEKMKTVKNRQKRNVAMTSILASQLNELNNQNLPRKLLKPEDFNLVKLESNEENSDKTKSLLEPKSQTSSEIEEVSSINLKLNELNIEQASKGLGKDCQTSTAIEVKNIENYTSKPKPTILMHPFSSASSMFRRPTPKPPQKSPENLDSIQKPEEVPKKKGYVPSPQAEEYYKKFVETSELRKAVTEDLWTRTMRKMKEIDQKRKDASEKSLIESKNTDSISVESLENLFVNLPECDSDDNETKNDSQSGHTGPSPMVFSTATSSESTLEYLSGFPPSILLPQHRDLLTGNCAVCKAFKKAT